MRNQWVMVSIGLGLVVGALADALNADDHAEVRRLLEEHRRLVPDDVDQIRRAHELLLACLENPGPLTRAEAQRFFDTERASKLRRTIWRRCLQPDRR